MQLSPTTNPETPNARSGDSEKRSWLEWLEAYVLYRLDALEPAEQAYVRDHMDLDAFYNAQSADVRHALNVCIASQGAGLDELLDHFAGVELA